MKKLIAEFKTFALKGNVVDMAVGVIIGGAFGKIVSSLVNDIFMPIIGVISGGIQFTNLSITVGESQIKYGSFIQNVVDFLIIALVIFAFVKFVNLFHRKKETSVPEPKKADEVILLEEILAELKSQNRQEVELDK